ncbi:hypothetical protein PoB_002721700 [Plakobranchus ocellatus]|uniref:SAM domain-containing protein n=1 Tax=Plakobranchus ocellatus TaxID=259542 RepID=A0AAV4A094_9GAST|nr:hypothetical protein PoB_002721700 [Plakobranchus ocellatus]
MGAEKKGGGGYGITSDALIESTLTKTGYDSLASRVKLMSCTELRGFLVQHFKAKNLPDEAFTCLENQEICGETFLSLTEEDLKGILPNAKFGTIRLLSLLIKKLTEQPPWGKNMLQSFCRELLEATKAGCLL